MWGTLAMLPLLMGSGAAAPGGICAQTGPDLRAAIASNEVHVAPEVKALLLDATDGKQDKVAAEVQEMRSRFDADEMTEWLNLALFQATYYNRADVAEWLIGQGADVNAHPMNIAFANSPKRSDEERVWPPLEQAADCGNTAALKVLLAHHADMYSSLREPRPEPGALLLAMMGRHEDTVNVLLDRGYDPCLIHANYYPGPSAAQMAKRRGLSSTLTARLSALSQKCATPAPAQSAATR
ncbi:MAG TPA: hypothetical protein VF022_07430 [Rhodanobacteraceae bacterium]